MLPHFHMPIHEIQILLSSYKKIYFGDGRKGKELPVDRRYPFQHVLQTRKRRGRSVVARLRTAGVGSGSDRFLTAPERFERHCGGLLPPSTREDGESTPVGLRLSCKLAISGIKVTLDIHDSTLHLALDMGSFVRSRPCLVDSVEQAVRCALRTEPYPLRQCSGEFGCTLKPAFSYIGCRSLTGRRGLFAHITGIRSSTALFIRRALIRTSRPQVVSNNLLQFSGFSDRLRYRRRCLVQSFRQVFCSEVSQSGLQNILEVDDDVICTGICGIRVCSR